MNNIKNIIFDFGNVLVRFDPTEIIKVFCKEEKQQQVLKDAIFLKWLQLDAGLIDYDGYVKETIAYLPCELKKNAEQLFADWYKVLPYIEKITGEIPKLKEKGYRIYLLSNAPAYLSQNASYFKILDNFDGLLFSGDIKMVKPNREIYEHLLNRFELKAEECLFFDDSEKNLKGAKACGINGQFVDRKNMEAAIDVLQKL